MWEFSWEPSPGPRYLHQDLTLPLDPELLQWAWWQERGQALFSSVSLDKACCLGAAALRADHAPGRCLKCMSDRVVTK